jgi:dienelactone hydrolase
MVRLTLAVLAALALAPAGCSGVPTAAIGSGAGTESSPSHYGIAERVMTFVDHSRVIRIPGRRPQARRIVTVVRYPVGAPGPFGLVVFGHGFAVTPAYYFRLLRSWARAGYVVAAPVFPLGNAHAPGGPDEADIVNQPRDMSFVITRLLNASAASRGPLAGLIDPHRIAVSGQSDGAETAVAVAYSSLYRDPRVRAAISLSGAELPGGTYFQPGSPPLLAVQGTADHINRPRNSYALFAAAPRPKYLLRLIGAGHLPPYTYQQPQLSIVERVTLAFLARYLKDDSRAARTMRAAGDVAGTAELVARP